MLETITNNKFIYPCCYLYGFAAVAAKPCELSSHEPELDTLKAPRLRLNDVRGILEEHLQTIENTKKLTYEQRTTEADLYRELIRQPDQEITETAYKRYDEKRNKNEHEKGIPAFIVALFMFSSPVMPFIMSLLVSFQDPYTMILTLIVVLSVSVYAYTDFNSKTCEYKRKMDVAVATHVMVIHALKKDFNPIDYTVNSIINYKQ